MNIGKEKVCPFTQSYIDCTTCKMYERGTCLIMQNMDGLKMLGHLDKLNQLSTIAPSAKRLNEFENLCLKTLDKIQKDVASLKLHI